MGDRIRKWIAVLLAGSILAMIQLVPAGGAVFVRENIENKEILGEKETSLQQTLHARAWVLMDADSGRILAGKDADTAYPMASTTKIMTSLLAAQSGKLHDEITVSKEMILVEGTSMGLLPGDSVSLYELIYGMLLPSGNDAANVTAYYLGGNVENFVKKMNAKAKEIGMENTNFVTPSGLDDEMHYSTAYDMALLGRYAVGDPVFRSVCSSKKASLSYGNPPYKRTLYNHNRLLESYKYALGIKTGFTKKSGRCLVSYAEKDGTGYEIIAGHRRCRGSELAGVEELPCIVRDMTDVEAVREMKNSNKQRGDPLPSELAKLLDLEVEAIKHQGGRLDGVAPGDVGKRSVEIVGEAHDMNYKKVMRYLRLNSLVPELLSKVDEKGLGFMPAVEISYIKPKNQRLIAVSIDGEQSSPSHAQAKRLRELDQAGKLNGDVIDGILSEKKKEDRGVIISMAELEKYFGKEVTPVKMKEQIMSLLDEWKEKQPPELKKPEKKADLEK